MSFKSFLSSVGHEVNTVFKWLGSPQGQATVSAVETGAVVATSAINPAAGAALVGIENLINIGLKQVISIEAMSVAAAQQSGTGAQKAAAVAAVLTPQISSTLQSLGIQNPTTAQIQSIADIVSGALSTIVNAFPSHTS